MKSKNNGKKEFPKDSYEFDFIITKRTFGPKTGKFIKRKMNKRMRASYKQMLRNTNV